MVEGKAKVLGEVLKQTKPFRASHIVVATGLSRQLVHKHLTNLVAEGYLEKDGRLYLVVARSDLVDAMIDSSDSKKGSLLKLEPVDIIKKRRVNESIELSVHLRCAGITGSDKFKQMVNNQIDGLIEEFKLAKRYLNSKQVAEKKALRELDRNFDEMWEANGKFLGIDKDQLLNEIMKKEDAV